MKRLAYLFRKAANKLDPPRTVEYVSPAFKRHNQAETSTTWRIS